MKTISHIILLLLCCQSYATIHTVTSDTDNSTTPQEGMLRYYVNQASNGDTIHFDVSQVTLQATLTIPRNITIDGGSGVILDAAQQGKVLNISFRRVVLRNLTLQNGYAQDYGGGMYAYVSSDADLLVENCTFYNNTVTSASDGQGGGVRTNNGTFINCKFIDNQVVGSTSILGGGGVYAVGGRFINCVFAGNIAAYGGGMYTSNAQLLNCTFTQNSASGADSGGGINCENATLTNCIIYNNTANSTDDNIKNISSTVSYSALETGNTLVGSNQNIGLSQTPFVHSGADSLGLKSGSSCIDAGNSAHPDLPAYDIIGTERLYNGTVDMGAYEYFVPPPEYLMTNDVVSVRNAKFYDSGGKDGSFTADENYIMTFIPQTSGKSLQCTFSFFYTATGNPDPTRFHGWLRVYDGLTTQASLIGAYSSNDIPVDQLLSTNADGALTFYFTSYEPAGGWEATLEEVNPQIDSTPVASFRYTTSGSTPMEVPFTDYSYQNPGSWFWDFGDASTSTERHPLHTFAETGIYDVSLVVSNLAGSDTVTWPVKTGDINDYYIDNERYATTDFGLFYDDGGPEGSYSHDVNDTLTFYPATAGNAMVIDFYAFETKGDYLYIFDGENTSAPLIDRFRCHDEIGTLAARNASGALTFVFNTNRNGLPNCSDIGWKATVKTRPMHSVSFTSDVHGSINGAVSQTIPDGFDAVAVTAIPGDGYHFVQWENASGDSLSRSNPLQVRNVHSDTTLNAVFGVNTYTLTFTSEANGYLQGDSIQGVDHGATSSEVTAVANEGYYFRYWRNPYYFINQSNPIQINNVTFNDSWQALFAVYTFDIRFSAGIHGYIDGETHQTVEYNNNATTVEAIADSGYHFIYWRDGNGDSISNQNPLIIPNITRDSVLYASFAINSYTAEFRTEGNGYISGDTLQHIEHGADADNVYAIAHAGNEFVYWKNEAGDTASLSGYLKLRDITNDTVVTAVFSPIVNSISGYANTHTSVYPNPVTDILTVVSDNMRQIELYTDSGQLVYQQRVKQSEYQLNMRIFPEGVYILQITSNTGIYTTKIFRK